MTWRTALTTGFFSFLCGTLVGWYAFLPMPFNLLSSVGALIAGVWFFRKFDSRKMRIAFIVLSIFYMVLFLILMSLYITVSQMPIPS
ncbi:hypothetical protein MH117_09180 [Paenibacillus sp. ACRRX]|uniref:hypothetical protein n=1 Tax=unclassified Paenibacillus TaxID=185978 RepID=UPI001EF5F8CB|nr:MULTISPECIES: hypothetical protein [unclassified Paenibacillus]MCG7407595.1 hypothetical protein [Paenibacillus sp. ACRRX]MDK8180830.1 hypothetical protein [Paenibacillus sp. UMB4589-SE434]